MRCFDNKLLTVGCVATILCLSANQSMANNLLMPGTRAMGMAGAVFSSADDSSAVFYNPAGLALSHARRELSIEYGTLGAESEEQNIKSFSLAYGLSDTWHFGFGYQAGIATDSFTFGSNTSLYENAIERYAMAAATKRGSVSVGISAEQLSYGFSLAEGETSTVKSFERQQSVGSISTSAYIPYPYIQDFLFSAQYKSASKDVDYTSAANRIFLMPSGTTLGVSYSKPTMLGYFKINFEQAELIHDYTLLSGKELTEKVTAYSVEYQNSFSVVTLALRAGIRSVSYDLIEDEETQSGIGLGIAFKTNHFIDYAILTNKINDETTEFQSISYTWQF